MSAQEINLHTVRIDARLEKVMSQIVLWGEAAWWPKTSQMRFRRTTTPGPVQKGTRYRQSVLLPFAPSWNVEVERVTDTSITRTFLDGMFSGFETVRVKMDKYDVVVTYEMHGRVNGIVNRALWPLVFRRMHDANIEAILKSLKNFLEERG